MPGCRTPTSTKILFINGLSAIRNSCIRTHLPLVSSVAFLPLKSTYRLVFHLSPVPIPQTKRGVQFSAPLNDVCGSGHQNGPGCTTRTYLNHTPGDPPYPSHHLSPDTTAFDDGPGVPTDESAGWCSVDVECGHRYSRSREDPFRHRASSSRFRFCQRSSGYD